MLLIIALLVGGTSVRGMPTTFIMQLCALVLLPPLVDWDRPGGFSAAVTALLIAGLLIFVLQLLPAGSLLQGPLLDLGHSLPAPFALTMDWNRTAEALVFVLPGALLFLVLGRFSENDFNRLLPFFYLGLLFNIVFGLVQFAARGEVSLGFLPYEAAAGFFANQNHFASLMFIGIPLIIYQFVVLRRPLLSLAAVAVVILVSFATRSVAGVFLSLGCALFSYALVARMATLWRLVLVALVLVGAIVLSTNPGNILELRPDDPLDRLSIWRNTLSGIAEYLPVGSGFGTFELVYPQFEAVSDIRPSFINHAHNEYLELLLEGGALAGAAILSYFLLAGFAMWRLPRSELRSAAFCGLLFVLVHSFFDYPLRNPSLLLVFVLLNAIVFSRHLEPRLASPRLNARDVQKTASA